MKKASSCSNRTQRHSGEATSVPEVERSPSATSADARSQKGNEEGTVREVLEKGFVVVAAKIAKDEESDG